MSRKIVQVLTGAPFSVLCEDGTIWWLKSAEDEKPKHWRQMDFPEIPPSEMDTVIEKVRDMQAKSKVDFEAMRKLHVLNRPNICPKCGSTNMVYNGTTCMDCFG